jgi:nucleoside-diphosphate-sugar epimerase
MILVTGGTGLVGSHLLYFLLKENASVRAIRRKNSDIQGVKKVFALYTSEVDSLFNKIEWVGADIIDIPALTEAFKNITTVYHCAAIINFNPSKYSLLKKINEEGTANIVNLCLSNHVEKLCYVSSVAALGSNLNNQLVNEESSWNPDEKNNVYAITKYAAEMQVWRGTQEGLNAVIVNPGVVLGTSPDGGGSSRIISMGKRGMPYYPSGTMGIVDVKDVAKTMKALMDSEIINQQFVLVGENMPYKELLSKLAILFGKKPPTKKLSKRLLFFLSGMDWLSNKLFKTKRRIVKSMVRAMFKTSHYDSSKIKNTLNFQFIPTEETLKRVAEENKKSLN